MISKTFFIYILVGLSCALIDIGSMQLLILCGVNYLIATTIGFIAGFILNFCLHTRVTFKARYSHLALIRFMVVVLINYLLTLCTVYVFQVLIDMPLLGKILSLPLVAINGFFLIKYWVYNKRTEHVADKL